MPEYTNHPEYLALLETVLASPADDAPRGILADWLDDHDQPERAEAIRIQLALAADWPDHITINCPCPTCAAHARANLLIGDHRREWFGPVWDRVSVNNWYRGWPEWVEMPSGDFMAHAAELFRTHPVTEVRLTDVEPWVGRIGAYEPTFWSGSEYSNDVALGELPDEIYRLLEGGTSDFEDGHKEYRNKQDALSALSDACVAYGRSLAGLPPLTGVVK